MAEAQLVDGIMRLLKQRGAWAFKTHGTVMGRRGIPDIVGAYRGEPLALEAKQPGNYATPLQRHELKRAGAAGAWAMVVRGVEDVEKLLSDIDTIARIG